MYIICLGFGIACILWLELGLGLTNLFLQLDFSVLRCRMIFEEISSGKNASQHMAKYISTTDEQIVCRLENVESVLYLNPMQT